MTTQKTALTVQKAALGTILILAMAVTFTGVAGFTEPGDLHAGEDKLEIKQNTGIKDILSERIGKRVSIKTDSGEALEATVVSVGDNLVYITKLSGKDFYDAVVRIDKITSIIFKARDH